MLGWFRAEAACASRSKRLRACGVWREPVRKEFQGDEAVELGVLGLVDHSHAAATEFFEDAVVRDGLANHGWSATVWGDVRGDVEVESTKVARLCLGQLGNVST